MDQFLQAKKRKLEEVDRTEMRQAYAAQYNVQPEREYEGSDHMLGVLKRVLFRGEFLTGSQLDLNRIVAQHPKDGELKFQRLQTKDDTDWIQEEANKVYDEKQWKRTMMIWRSSLLMVLASCPSPSNIRLKKTELHDFSPSCMAPTAFTGSGDDCGEESLETSGPHDV